LFSGIGGFALAAGWAGFETIGFSEIDGYASQVLKRHWPNVKNYGDIKNIKGPEIGAVELITGGFPCQPFSVAGKRRGKEDDRYLWPEMLRVISECKPRWVLGENVAGIVAMELENCLLDLEGIGYGCQPIIIPAGAVDAPHRRDRVWILAHSNGIRHNQGRKESILSGEKSPIQIKQRDRRSGETSGCSRWNAEPDICRVDDGIRDGSHRIKGLGNAIVPQVAYQILRLMI